ncbi:glucuronate isomerase [Enterococcus sp. DIV0876]|uniref:glucuronate isomerase n=1 Tax=Enterococcus sp. DIV0876 TaxID=2774633 RepID=UPI003D2FDACB
MFLDENFVCTNDVAKQLYHEYAKDQPIIDYHCHLDPKEIYEDRPFKNITEAWLGGDHYKWRLMRANGVPEELITGEGADYDKFAAWAETIEMCIGNPLYIWTNLELRRIFGIEEVLTKKNAPLIWDKANQKLAEAAYSPRQLIKKMNVALICTTDEPIDELVYHQKLKGESFAVFPTFRPDKSFNIHLPEFKEYLQKLSAVSEMPIKDYPQLVAALAQRVAYFHRHGCRLSDHSLARLSSHAYDPEQLATIFAKKMADETLSNEEIMLYQTGLLLDLMKVYAAYGWTAQLHLSATRNNSSVLMRDVGPDSGGDAMGDSPLESGLSRLFDQLHSQAKLPQTILYSLNPKDYVSLTALMGCFQEETKGKLQLGAAWWFNDTYSGMRHQLTTVAEGGVLGNFVGMLTDSRSFLSYPRHEYFRRILCQVISEWVADGQLPEDLTYLGGIVEKIAYQNALSYFNFGQ